MSLYRIINTTYKNLLPKGLRDKMYRLMPLPLKKLRFRIVRELEKTGKHDEIYDRCYYLEHEEPSMAQAADVIASSIMSEFSPRSVVDVGCGTGLLLLALKRIGVQDCRGAEYSEAALEICKKRGIDVVKFDLEQDVELGLKADVVVSTEVAEHLPASCADHFVDILCGIADTIILTASPPSRWGGVNHVNEQPNEYWIEKFVSRNYKYLSEPSMKWRKHWKDRDVTICFTTSLMLFKREPKVRGHTLC
jgi:SAM-dependent methyltransferase